MSILLTPILNEFKWINRPSSQSWVGVPTTGVSDPKKVIQTGGECTRDFGPKSPVVRQKEKVLRVP